MSDNYLQNIDDFENLVFNKWFWDFTFENTSGQEDLSTYDNIIWFRCVVLCELQPVAYSRGGPPPGCWNFLLNFQSILRNFTHMALAGYVLIPHYLIILNTLLTYFNRSRPTPHRYESSIFLYSKFGNPGINVVVQLYKIQCYINDYLQHPILYTQELFKLYLM